MLDLTKLPAASWVDGGPDCFEEGIWTHCVDGPDGLLAKVECNFPAGKSHRPGWGCCEKAQAIVEFIVLAHNAFDVMMRRGWTVSRHMQHDRFHGWWIVFDEWDRDLFIDGVPGDSPAPEMITLWPDPFTALVEADRWYRENVEAKASTPTT